MKPLVKASGTKRLRLRYDGPLSNFAFKFNLRRYSKAAEIGKAHACLQLAQRMYLDAPYTREVGHVEEAVGVAMSAGDMEGHDVPPAVMTGVVHWLRKGGYFDLVGLDRQLGEFRKVALEGAKHCFNEGCEVVGYQREFKVCPQCKTARYWATRVRNRTGQRVGTGKSVAHSSDTFERYAVLMAWYIDPSIYRLV